MNRFQSVFSMCHLYNALHQEKLLSRRWRDLDLIMEIHGYSAIFDGSIPVSIADCFSRIGSIGENSIEIRRGELNCEQITPFSETFLENISVGDCDTVPEDIGNKILELFPTLEPDPEKSKKTTYLHSKIGFKEVEQRWKKWGKIEPTDLLANLAIVLQLEVPVFYYDYLKMHRICWKILQDVDKNGSKNRSEIEGGLHYIVPDCMMDRMIANQSGDLIAKAPICIIDMLESGSGSIVTDGLPPVPDVQGTKYELLHF